MRLNKVKMTDFRQFYGDIEIDLETTNKNNVIIIHGENGVGKTAFLNAIKWCFFEKVTTNFRHPKKLVNQSAFDSGKKVCRVEIVFEEGGDLFSIQRKYDQETQKSDLKMFKIKEHVYGPSLPEPELIINGMLPNEMAEYFFFQGEGSSAVNAGNKDSSLSESIRDILGFRVAESLVKSLKLKIRELRKKIADNDKTGESQLLNTKIQNNEKNLEIALKQKKDIELRLPRLESDLENVENELSKFSNVDLISLRRDEKELEENIKTLKGKIAALELKQLKMIGLYGWAAFGDEFAEASLDFIDESQLKGRIPEPYNKTFIDDILSSKKCICGCDLEVGSDGYKKITSMLEKAANPQLVQRLSGIRAQIQDIATLNSVASDNIGGVNAQLSDYDAGLQKNEHSLKAVSEKIKKLPEEEISQSQKRKIKINKDLNEQRQLLGRLIERVESLDSLIKTDTKNLSALKSGGSIVSAFNKRKDFIQEIIDYINDYLNRQEENIREYILSKVNDTLRDFSRHDFHIKVSKEDFKFSLKDKNENDVGHGDGMNLLLNLTITTSLISYVAENVNCKDPILSSATVAPLVIDAPFGVLDDRYRKVVVGELPKNVGQIIFLVSSSQWTDEMDEKVRGRVASEYVLVLEERSSQGNRTIDKFTISGNDIVVSKYDCDIDRTIIQKV